MKSRMTLILLMLLQLFSFSSLAEGMEHYLLLGVDGWGISEEGSARSDAIILVSLDSERERIVLTSFARDSIVKPSYRKGTVKLNTLVRSSKGEQMLEEYLEETFGIAIEGYFVINFSGTVDLVNAVGGVELELSADEASYIEHHAGYYYGYPVREGRCRLNGAQALYYMRCRSLDNDFGRQGRQGKVMRALMDGVRGLSPIKMLAMLDDVLGMYRTSLGYGQQIELVLRALTLLDAEVITASIPAEGTYRYGEDSYHTSGLIFDLKENRSRLYQLFQMENPFEKENEENDVPAAA